MITLAALLELVTRAAARAARRAAAAAWPPRWLDAVFWLQRDYPGPLAAVTAPRPAAAAHRAPTAAELTRRRILALYWEADAPARDTLLAHSWPAYT